MALPEHELLSLIQEALPDAQIVIKPLVDDQNHYAVTVTSPTFKGKSRIQQHQMVYQALGGKMGNELHAMSLTTGIPD